MSLNAKRYQKRLTERPTTKHHVPPQHPQVYVVKRINAKHHRAYHMLFGASPSLEECVAILKRFWWPSSPAGPALPE